jgi:hypothetical protein
VITAFADTDNSGAQNGTEPSTTATKTWILPTSGAACKVTYGGRIATTDGDKATFGGNAKGSGPSGQEEFQDHGPTADMNLHSINVQAVVCSEDGTAASIFGTATIDGVGLVDYRIDVTDQGEPGTSDTYEIRLSNGYDSGLQTLSGGNVQIHVAKSAAAVTTGATAKGSSAKGSAAHKPAVIHKVAPSGGSTGSAAPSGSTAPVDKGSSHKPTKSDKGHNGK